MSDEARQAHRRQLAEKARDENRQLAIERREGLAALKAHEIEADRADAGTFYERWGRNPR